MVGTSGAKFNEIGMRVVCLEFGFRQFLSITEIHLVYRLFVRWILKLFLSINCQLIHSKLVSGDRETRCDVMWCDPMSFNANKPNDLTPRFFALIEIHGIPWQMQKEWQFRELLYILRPNCVRPNKWTQRHRNWNESDCPKDTRKCCSNSTSVKEMHILTSSSDGLSLWQMIFGWKNLRAGFFRCCFIKFTFEITIHFWQHHIFLCGYGIFFPDFAKAAKIAEWEFMAATSKY